MTGTALPTMQAHEVSSGWRAGWGWLRHYLPEGRGLPHEEWRIRHRAVVVFIFAHAIGLAIFGLVRDWPPVYALGEGLLIAGLGGIAMMPQLTRKMRGGVAALGCVTSSAVLVQFWGGVIEAHFHFFVVVALISLYQDWVPFLLSIVFVALDHGLTGVLLPDWVYNHGAARAEPWRWAVIHAVFVLAECVALVVVWRANEQARAETDRVLRSTGEGLIGVDAECRVTFANPAAVNMSGGNERELLGKPLYMMLLGGDGRPLFGGPEILRQNPGAFSLEAHLARQDGRRTPVEVLCTPIEGHGHAEGAVVAMRDLTDRLRVEKERHVATLQAKELDHLREVNSFKTRFMNMAAHELNTPLTPIKLQMHVLKAHSEEPELETHKRSIHLLDRNFQRLAGLVGDLLDSTRLQSDRLPMRPQPLDLAALASEVTTSFGPAYQGAGITLRLDAPPTLPCRADANRLTQALSNLLANSLKFTPAGGSVDVRLATDGTKATVAVKDTGVGMSPAQVARLFQPFEQVHEGLVITKGGSGLGLYIARGIVEMHGGAIWCTSEGPDKGTTFTFEIPLSGPVVMPADEGDGTLKEPPLFDRS